MRSDSRQANTCGNGLMCTARSLESGDRILIEIRRIWHRLMARNMPLTTTGRKFNTRIGEAQPVSCAGQAQRRETLENRKIVEGENYLTRFKYAFQYDAGKTRCLFQAPSSSRPSPIAPLLMDLRRARFGRLGTCRVFEPLLRREGSPRWKAVFRSS